MVELQRILTPSTSFAGDCFNALLFSVCVFQPQSHTHSVHDNFSEVSGQFVRTNSRMSRHLHICLDMIILISDEILCSLLLAIMYAVVVFSYYF